MAEGVSASTVPGKDSGPTIGRANEPVRVLAFSGGAYGTIPQLGTAHALLASDARLPDVVVGTSAGAINAVALAEILQAGDEAPGAAAPATPTLGAKVAKLMEMVEAYASADRDLLQALLPDVYQVAAQRPLAPVDLPLQAQPERTRRDTAVAAKAGLIRFANDLLGLRITVGAFARGMRLALGWRAAKEAPPIAKAWERLLVLYRGWVLVGRNLTSIAPIVTTVGGHLFATLLCARARRILRLNRGQTAAELIFTGDSLLRRVLSALIHACGLAVLALLWLSPLATAIGAMATLWCHWWPDRTPGLLSLGAQRDVATAIFLGFLTFAVCVVSAVALALGGEALSHRLFRYYEIANGWFDPHPLRERFIQLFDPGYDGQVDIDAVVSSVLRNGPPPDRKKTSTKTLGGYATAAHPLHVGVVGARVEDGRLDVLSGTTPVVDGLMVATALPPLFQAQAIGDTWYVDGALIVREPTRALIPYLKTRVDPKVSSVHIYSVVPGPLSQSTLATEGHEYTSVTGIARRSLQLQRFRDAALDQKMTHLYSQALGPDGPALHEIDQKRFLRAWVYPLEPDDVSQLPVKLLAAHSDPRRRQAVLEAIADGCRASLEAMLPDVIARVAHDGKASCHEVVRAFAQGGRAAEPAASPGPGVRQVCENCALQRSAEDGSRSPQTLRLRPDRKDWPAWPRKDDTGPSAVGRPIALPASDYDTAIRDSLRRRASAQAAGSCADVWPRGREGGLKGEQRPTISLLFAGGVFRGVYLTGVVNALSEIGVRPDIIAGSSVGTITAAMAASVFAADSPRARRVAMVRLVSAFLALDRLVLTDRLADFVRGLTLRAAAVDFSPRQLDQLFRTFDRAEPGAFSSDTRRVLAGLERLLYVSPFEVAAIARSVRKGARARTAALLAGVAQDFLDRCGVGLEMLGAAPLATLIEHYVVRPQWPDKPLVEVGLDAFASKGIYLLATATNLTCGRLDLLGGDEVEPSRRAVLLESLLASSAFPAVFRPRWSYEVMPLCGQRDQYVDGGVMDNLPLDAVARFLSAAASTGLVTHRPRVGERSVPHLVFTASLEVERARLAPREAARQAESWLDVYRRVRELGYNTKLDAYRRMQRDLRAIRRHRNQPVKTQDFDDLLDLEIVDVKPKWLCGTFAFHPMLGFSRADQAASIAHGCASTLRRFGEIRSEPEGATWIAPWGIDPKALPDRPSLAPQAHGENVCHFRQGVRCPFSAGELSQLADPAITPEIVQAVSQVYKACGRSATHRAR